VHALPNAEAGNDIAVCIGDSAQLSASGGIVYEWEAVAGISNRSMADPYVLLAASNTLTVKVTDANGCMAEDSVFVLVHPLPPVEAGDDEEICLNEEIKLKASGALSYQWEAHPSLSATDILAPTVTPTTTTTYRVVGTDANGCSHTDSVTVVVHELPIADAGADTAICTGDTTQLAAKGGIRYTWENAPSLSETDVADPLAYPTQDQLYILTVTDIHNCTDRDSVFIQVYELPNAEAGDDIAVCIGDSTQLSATGGVSYEWEATNGMSDRLIATPKVLLAGSTNLRVQVTDANTCMAEDSVFVLVHPLPPVEAGEEQELCLNEEVQLGASGATSYQWEADASLSAINIADPMASPRATLIYTVEGTDDNGCQNRDSVNIVVHMLPTANAGKDTAICVGDTTHLSGDGGTQYAWQQEASLSATDIADPVAYPTQDQLYVLRVTDIHSCTDTDSVFIQVYELPNAEAGDDIAVCIGDSTQLSATGGIAYEWEAISGIADISVANPKLLLAGSSTISVLVTDANGCMAEDSVFVLVNALPLVEAGVEQEICLFEDAQLQASGANTYQWRLNASLSGTGIANPVASPVMTTLYQVEGTDQNGCKASDSLWVKVYPLPVIDVQDSVSICEGESVVLGAFTNSSLPLFWSNGETGESILLENPEEQYYQVVATTTMGCKDSARTFLEIVPLPEAIFSVDKDFDVEMLEVSFVNESLNATSYSWEFGDRATSTEENPTHTYTLTGEYETELIAYNELGCPDTTSVGPLTVQNIRIFIPSAFSPNGDGKNDEYFVVANGVEALSIQIFDRWGKVITELNSANATWDGTLNGQPVPLGTYPVTVRGISGKRRLPIKSSGTIVLFR
ncbi:MAG: PKD domain-containing protein, partial [Bacteroidota bacterium]